MFRVLADIILVNIEISEDEIDFRFDDESHEMFTSKTIQLTNNGNSDANYKWKIPDDCCFSVEEKIGSVLPG